MSIVDGVIFARARSREGWTSYEIKRGPRPRMVEKNIVTGAIRELDQPAAEQQEAPPAPPPAPAPAPDPSAGLSPGLHEHVSKWVGEHYRPRALEVAREYSAMDIGALAKEAARLHDEALSQGKLGEPAIRSLASGLVLRYRQRQPAEVAPETAPAPPPPAPPPQVPLTDEEGWQRDIDRRGMAQRGNLTVKVVTHPAGGFMVRTERTIPGTATATRNDLPESYPSIDEAQKAVLAVVKNDGQLPPVAVPDAYVRTTPVPGSPERVDLKSRVDALDAELDSMREKLDAREKEYDRAKYGTPKRDKLRGQVDTLREQFSERQNAAKGIREQLYRANLEDLAITGDPAQRLGALGLLKAVPEKQAYERIRQLGEEEARRQGATDQQLIHSAGLDVASTLSSYPHFNPLAKQVELTLSRERRGAARRVAVGKIEALGGEAALGGLTMSHRGEYIRRIEAEDNHDRMNEIIEEARERHEAMKAGAASGQRAAQELARQRMTFSADLKSVRVQGTGTDRLANMMFGIGLGSERWATVAARTGWATDGKWAFEMQEPEKQKIMDAAAPLANPHPKAAFTDVPAFAQATKPAGPAQVVGVRRDEGDPEAPVRYLIDGSQRLEVNAKLFKIVNDRLPGAQMLIGLHNGDPNRGMLIWQRNGKTVGMLMPLGTEKADLDAATVV